MNNKFYIAQRKKDKSGFSYVIRATPEFGGTLLGSYKSKELSRWVFNKATKEAEQYEKELEKML